MAESEQHPPLDQIAEQLCAVVDDSVGFATLDCQKKALMQKLLAGVVRVKT